MSYNYYGVDGDDDSEISSDRQSSSQSINIKTNVQESEQQPSEKEDLITNNNASVSYIDALTRHPNKEPPYWWSKFTSYSTSKKYTKEDNQPYFIPPAIPDYYKKSIYWPLKLTVADDYYSLIKNKTDKLMAPSLSNNDMYSAIYANLIADLRNTNKRNSIYQINNALPNREICENFISQFPKDGKKMKKYFRTLCQLYATSLFTLFENTVRYYQSEKGLDTVRHTQKIMIKDKMKKVWTQIIYAAAVIRVREASYKLKNELEFKLEQKRKLINLLRMQRQRIMDHCFENETVQEQRHQDETKEKERKNLLEVSNENSNSFRAGLESKPFLQDNQKLSCKKIYAINAYEYKDFIPESKTDEINVYDTVRAAETTDKLAQLYKLKDTVFQLVDCQVFDKINLQDMNSSGSVTQEILFNETKMNMVSNSFYDEELPKKYCDVKVTK